MPSLNELGQFKSSFNNIANEKKDLESLSLPFDDLALPAKEAPPFNYEGSDTANTAAADTGGADFDFGAFVSDLSGDDPPLMETPSGGALSALDDFLNDLNTPSPDDPFTEEPQADMDADPLAESYFPPEDLLAGFSDLQSDPGDEDSSFDIADDFNQQADENTGDDWMNSMSAGDTESSPDLEDTFDFSSMNTEDDFQEADSQDEDDEDEMGIDMGGESRTGDFSFSEQSVDSGSESGAADFDNDDFGSIDLGGESQSAEPDDFGFGSDSSLAGGDLPVDDFNFDSGQTQETGALPDFDTGIDLGGESQESNDFSLDDFSGGDSTAPDSGFDDFPLDADFSGQDAGSDAAGSTLDLGDFGSDFSSDSIDLENEDITSSDNMDFGSESSSSDVFGSDDFSLSGLDDILNKSKTISIPTIEPKKRLFGRKKAKTEEEHDVPEDIEEISLSEEDVENLLRTLASYPLNLRIACEELIAEQVILPQQLSKLIRLLINGAHVKETAAHVELITGKPIIIPKSFEKSTGAAFEAEQSSFAYIFVHNFLPVLRLFAIIAALLASVIFLGYNFIYIPVSAESLYKRGYSRIPEGEYQRANELFHQAFSMHRKKKWFYSYAEAFRDQRRYMLAEGKYDELLRFYPRDKKGVLDYANLNTFYLMNYEKANRLLQRELLDFTPNDREGLLAAGDNFLIWADSNPARFFDRYEDARFSYARLLELYGWQAPVVERMMKYFIRVDDLREVLQIRIWFESSNRRRLSADSLAELGGYLLDKQIERRNAAPGVVPDPYVENIESVRNMLLEAVSLDLYLPEPHYHLARYHHNLGNNYEERLTLENAIRAFDLARQETVRRRIYRVDSHYRYANLLINNREFFPAEEQAIRGIELFEDFLNRNLIPASPQLGQLYSIRGDLEYFVKMGNMQAALSHYHTAERYGYSPPEVQYRIGAAYYHTEDWRNALEYLFKASAELPLNRRMLFALGNAAFQRGDYFAAEGYYNRLLDVLEQQRVRLPVLLPNDNVQFLETGERLMMARNNAGVVSEALAEQTGNSEHRSKAMVMFVESARAWDAITRNPQTMTRMRLTDSPGAPSINLGYLNANNALRSNSNYRPQIFVRIDRDVLEPSKWEELTAF